VSNHVDSSGGGTAIPDTVRYAFYIGAVVMFTAIGWTVWRSREYPPEALQAFADAQPVASSAHPTTPSANRRHGGLWTVIGLVGIALVRLYELDPQLYLLCIGALLWGLGLLAHSASRRPRMFHTIMNDLQNMPDAMRRLIPVQFFSWLALFAMWIYTTPAVTAVHFGASDPRSEAYNEGANWVGVLFGAYNGFAALAALIIPILVARLGLRLSHLVNLWIGGAALISFHFIRDPTWLLVSMVGVGFAWASILSLPYALLSDSVPARKMGIFNFFIVSPQLIAASVLGFFLKTLFGGAPIYALILGGLSFFVAGAFSLRVPQPRTSAV
jgi:maltose/moltooligosaccharide transporter